MTYEDGNRRPCCVCHIATAKFERVLVDGESVVHSYCVRKHLAKAKQASQAPETKKVAVKQPLPRAEQTSPTSEMSGRR